MSSPESCSTTWASAMCRPADDQLLAESDCPAAMGLQLSRLPKKGGCMIHDPPYLCWSCSAVMWCHRRGVPSTSGEINASAPTDAVAHPKPPGKMSHASLFMVQAAHVHAAAHVMPSCFGLFSVWLLDAACILLLAVPCSKVRCLTADTDVLMQFPTDPGYRMPHCHEFR